MRTVPQLLAIAFFLAACSDKKDKTREEIKCGMDEILEYLTDTLPTVAIDFDKNRKQNTELIKHHFKSDTAYYKFKNNNRFYPAKTILYSEYIEENIIYCGGRENSLSLLVNSQDHILCFHSYVEKDSLQQFIAEVLFDEEDKKTLPIELRIDLASDINLVREVIDITGNAYFQVLNEICRENYNMKFCDLSLQEKASILRTNPFVFLVFEPPPIPPARFDK